MPMGAPAFLAKVTGRERRTGRKAVSKGGLDGGEGRGKRGTARPDRKALFAERAPPARGGGAVLSDRVGNGAEIARAPVEQKLTVHKGKRTGVSRVGLGNNIGGLADGRMKTVSIRMEGRRRVGGVCAGRPLPAAGRPQLARAEEARRKAAGDCISRRGTPEAGSEERAGEE